jgi:hypothetical protein
MPGKIIFLLGEEFESQRLPTQTEPWSAGRYR